MFYGEIKQKTGEESDRRYYGKGDKMTKKQTNVFKGVAIILMFVHHLFGDAGVLKDMNVHPFVPQNILLMIASAGKVCVAIFVFASAYGITKQQEKSGTG